jgi:predicted permease
LASSFLPAIHWPLALDVPIDPTVVLVTLGLSVLAGVAIGLLPALRASRLSPAVLMKQEARTVAGGLYRSRLGRGLVVGQVALSVLLLISAGLFVRSAVNAHRFRPGFEVGSVLLSTLDLLPAGYSTAEGVELDRALLARVEALPGVESATLSDWVPLSFRSHTSVIEPEGYAAAPSESMEIARANVGPGYLRTLRVPLVAGRDLTPLDGRDAPRVALVNETLAGRYWPGQSAVGKRIRADANWYTVVGVAHDSKYESLTEGATPFIFLPLLQNYYPEATLYIRVAGEPLDHAAAVREAVAATDASLPLFDVTTLEARTGAAGFLSRMAGAIVGVFGLLALLLATVGIYGVVAHTIRQRTREVGIRVALGADPAAVQRLVLAQGVRLAVLGVTLGVGLALVLTRFLRAQLFGLTSTDPATFLAVAALLGVVAGLACWLPARRATRLDPMVALGRD